jgi:hypothetical protein
MFLASYHVINFDMLTNEVDQENLAKWIRSSAMSVLAFTDFCLYVAYFKIWVCLCLSYLRNSYFSVISEKYNCSFKKMCNCNELHFLREK